MIQKEKTDIAISVIVVSVALAFILYYSFLDEGFFRSETNKDYHVTTLVVDGKSYKQLTDSSLTVMNTKEVESSESIDTLVRADTLVSYKSDTSMVVNSLRDTEGSNQDAQENSYGIDDSSGEGSSATSPKYRTFDFDKNKSSSINDELKEKSSTQIDTPVIAEKIEYQNPDKNCIILIGSFSKNKNSTKLKSNLRSDGYSIFEVPYKNLMRIGVYTYCEKRNLEKELQTIRKKYASDAMIFVQD